MLLSDLLKEVLRDAGLDALHPEFDGACQFQLWDGTLPAATTDASDGVKIFEIALDAAFFPAPAAGVLVGVVPFTDVALADGSLAYFRIVNATPVVLLQGNVGLTGSDLDVDQLDYLTGDAFTVTQFDLAATVTP